MTQTTSMKSARKATKQVLQDRQEFDKAVAGIRKGLDQARSGERGRFYRPVKKPVTIRLDTDVVAWFKSHGKKYQTAINKALREYIASH